MSPFDRSYLMTHVVSQVGYQIPVLLVHLIAAILALVYLKQVKLAAILTLIGVAISAFAIVGVIAAQTIDMAARMQGARSFAGSTTAIAIVGSCLRAIGLGFLIAAIFAGRKPANPDDRHLHQ